ncbi:MAG TPA: hypothetical protein VG709_08105, partial [Actinomycetota bacterium]|nr:hypothetical protein [Actinomycetota bacterium]
PPPRSAFLGEVSLTGRVRQAPNVSARLRAAAAAGVETVFAAADERGPGDMRVVPVRNVVEALRWCRGSDAGTSGSRRSSSREAALT